MSSLSSRARGTYRLASRPRANDLTLDRFRQHEAVQTYVLFPGLWRTLCEAAGVVGAAAALTILVLVSLPS
jgi:hypothetical protein